MLGRPSPIGSFGSFHALAVHDSRRGSGELCGSLGDGGDQAARLAGRTMTSVPSWKVTPATTFGNWVSPLSRLQPLAAAMMSLNTISLAVVGESAPLVRTVRCRTVANTLDRVCRSQVVPVLGGQVVEGEQGVAILRQALGRPRVLGAVLLGKDVHRRLGRSTSGRTMDLAQVRLHGPLDGSRHLVENVGGLVHDANTIDAIR